VATDRLSLPEMNSVVAGAGLFPCFAQRLRLTQPDCRCTSHWLLPAWFHPEERNSALSYHRDLSRWRMSDAGAMVTSVSKGQEFVLDCGDYTEAINWLRTLLAA
jgi:hypothetical protein